jgi:AmmeMemoRadiSam system protein B
VVSSDLSHYHNKREAKELDDKVAENVKRFDYETLQSLLDKGSCEACGGGGITALLRAASNMGKKKIDIIDRSDSGDVTEDASQVVGYLSAAIYS